MSSPQLDLLSQPLAKDMHLGSVSRTAYRKKFPRVSNKLRPMFDGFWIDWLPLQSLGALKGTAQVFDKAAVQLHRAISPQHALNIPIAKTTA